MTKPANFLAFGLSIANFIGWMVIENDLYIASNNALATVGIYYTTYTILDWIKKLCLIEQ